MLESFRANVLKQHHVANMASVFLFLPDDKGTSNAKLCLIILTCIVEVSLK